MKFYETIFFIFITLTQTPFVATSFDGPLTCFSETSIGGPLENPTKVMDGCYSCLVCFIFKIGRKLIIFFVYF